MTAPHDPPDTAAAIAARQRQIQAAVAGSVLAILLGVTALSKPALRLMLQAAVSTNEGYPTPHPGPPKNEGDARFTLRDMERR